MLCPLPLPLHEPVAASQLSPVLQLQVNDVLGGGRSWQDVALAMLLQGLPAQAS